MNKLPKWIDDQAKSIAAEQPVDLSEDQIQAIRDKVSKRYASTKNLTNQAIRELAYALLNLQANRNVQKSDEIARLRAENERMIYKIAELHQRVAEALNSQKRP